MLVARGNKMEKDYLSEASIRSLFRKGGTAVITDEPNYLYVVYTSAKHQWKDDVEFYFDDANQRIEFRSGSRTGFGDLGVNRKRYDAIKAAYCG